MEEQKKLPSDVAERLKEPFREFLDSIPVREPQRFTRGEQTKAPTGGET